MTPTNEQIMAEVRWRTTAVWGKELEDTIIEVMREGYTPPEPEPEPVDPDILAFREWLVECRPACKTTASEGDWDQSIEARAYLAGARIAREQERERAKVLVEFAVALETFGLDDSISAIPSGAREALAKYKETAR